MGRNFITVLYYSITLLCVIISGILSYEGFQRSFPSNFLTFLFVLVIVIGLFGADALIQRARSSGQQLLGPLLLLIGFSVFSTASNFNAIYTRFMQEDAVVAALDEQLTVFRDDLTNTRKIIELDPRVQAYLNRETEVQRELERLRVQVSDPVRPGCGPRCLEHLANLESLLGKPLTDVAKPPPGASETFINAWFDRTKATVVQDFETATEDKVDARMRDLIQQIDAHLSSYEGNPAELARSQNIDALKNMAIISAEIARDANADLPESSEVVHTPIDTTLGRLGEIAYSFRNAFVQMPNALATFLSLILGAVVDLFPVAFALVAFNPQGGGPQARSQRKRGRAGKILN